MLWQSKNPLARWVGMLFIKFTPPCNDVVRIISRNMDEKPSLLTRIRLNMHYAICDWCKRYVDHLKAIRRIARQRDEAPGPAPALDSAAREKLKMAVKAAAVSDKS
jgi:hypothetical protein